MYSLLNISEKDVVTIKSGKKLGKIDDLRFDPVSSKIHSFIVFGKLKFFGLLGREPDISILYDDIVKIGTDVILVKWEPKLKQKKEDKDDLDAV